MPSVAVLTSISKEFNISLDWLLTGQKSNALDYTPPDLRKMMESVNILDPNERAMLNEYIEFLVNKKASKRPAPTDETSCTLLVAESPGIYEVKPKTETQYLPILGMAAAGSPLTAIPFIEGYIPIKEEYKDCFAVRVKGDSMVDADIPDGGFAIVRNQAQVELGEIALVMVDGEVAIKRFELKDDRAALISANRKYKPIYVDARNDVKIIGKVVHAVSWDEVKDKIREDLSFLKQD